MLERKIEARQLVNIIALFLVVQFGGLLIAIYTTPAILYYVQGNAVQVNSFEGAFVYLIYILVTTAALLLLIRFYKKPGIFRLMEALVILLATGYVVFSVVSTALPGVDSNKILALAAIATVILIIAKNMRPNLRNLLAVSSSIGVGILIGSNGFYLAYFLMLLITIYDYVAVFITKHMLTMAKEVSSKNLAFLIGSTDYEAVPRSYLSKKDLAEYKKQGKPTDPFVKSLVRKGLFPVVSQVQLGTGDLALPLMLSVSAYISFLSYSAAVMIAIGASVGMIFTMYLLKRYKVALPAIPPLFAFCNLFLGIFFAINNFWAYRSWLGFIIIFIAIVLALFNKLNSAAAR